MKVIKNALKAALDLVEGLEKKKQDNLARAIARGKLEADVIGYYATKKKSITVDGVTYDVIVNDPACVVRVGAVKGPYAFKCLLALPNPSIVVNNAAGKLKEDALVALLEITAKTPAKGGLECLSWQEVELLDGSITNQHGLLDLLEKQIQDHPEYHHRLELAQSRVRSRA